MRPTPVPSGQIKASAVQAQLPLESGILLRSLGTRVERKAKIISRMAAPIIILISFFISSVSGNGSESLLDLHSREGRRGYLFPI